MTDLRIAEDFSLPIDAAVGRFVLLGKSGAGKTNGDTVIAEELIRAGIPVFILDPLGNMHGLRSSADGESAGLPVVIFGGAHADVPIGNPWQMARTLAGQRIPAVIDLSESEIDEQRTFAESFCTALMSAANGVCHVILEEADRFAPNTIGKNPVKTFARTARNKGIGWTFSTQRPQILSPEVIESASVIVAMKMPTGLAQDSIGRKIAGSFESKAQTREMLESLPRLRKGEAYFIPDADWLPDAEEDAVPVRFRFRLRETFDSARPPRVNDVQHEAKVFAAIDIEALREAFRIEEEPEDAGDVDQLRARVAELEEQLAQRPAEAARVEVPVLDGEALVQIERISAALALVVAPLELANEQWERVKEAIRPLAAIVERIEETLVPDPAPTVERSVQKGPGPARGGASTSGLPKAERLILTVLAQYPSGRTIVQVAILAGYAVNGGGFRNAVGALNSKGYLTKDGSGALLQITEAGAAALGDFERLPTGAALLEYWCSRLGKAEREALRALVAAYPNRLAANDVAERTGYQASGGGFRNALGKLRTLQLIEGYGAMRASDALFDRVRR